MFNYSAFLQIRPQYELTQIVQAMTSDTTLWDAYFNDFITHKLKLVDEDTLHSDSGNVEFAQQILHTLFEHLNNYDVPHRLVELHCHVTIHQLNLAQLTIILRPLSEIQLVRKMD